MGYYTDYDFSDNPDVVIAAIEEISGYGLSYDGYYSDIKWYSHTEHMIKISKQFPDILVKLEGVGEERGDLWKAYYKNGKVLVVTGKITYEEFDESKMKEYK